MPNIRIFSFLASVVDVQFCVTKSISEAIQKPFTPLWKQLVFSKIRGQARLQQRNMPLTTIESSQLDSIVMFLIVGSSAMMFSKSYFIQNYINTFLQFGNTVMVSFYTTLTLRFTSESPYQLQYICTVWSIHFVNFKFSSVQLIPSLITCLGEYDVFMSKKFIFSSFNVWFYVSKPMLNCS